MFPEITPYEAFLALAADAAPTLIDIRLPEDREGPERLPAAIDAAFDDIATHIAHAGHQGAILVCHKGLKLSAGATARLRARGVDAHRLSGGFVGWRAAGLPTLTAPAPTRIAIPLAASFEEAVAAWATCRFDAPKAELIEVPRDDLGGVLARFQASTPRIPFPLSFDGDCATLDALLSVQPPSAIFPVLDALFRARHETVMTQALQQEQAEEMRP